MDGKVMPKPFYRCVLCNEELMEDHLQSFVCRICGASYPNINGVNIFVLNPNALLSAHLSQMAENAMNLQRRLDLFATFEKTISPESLSRLKSSMHGLIANQELGNELFEPVQRYLEDQQAEANLLWFFTACPIGWSLNQLVPYFYRDWAGTKEANYLEKLFADAIEDYCGDLKHSVAVLGTGACGLLHRLSGSFSRSFGVDLSVPALLLARQLLEGAELYLHLNLPYSRFPRVQRRIRLVAPEKQAEGLKLIAADVNNLPFPSSSISCVITQYIMDLVPDQVRLAAEVNRVLAPRGVWINYGIPVGLADFDVPNHLDLHWFFDQTGFHPLEISLKRYQHLDLSSISRWRATETHSNIFFAVRKKDDGVCLNSNPFITYFSSGQRDVLNRIAKLSKRFEVSISNRREHAGAGIMTKYSIEVQNVEGELFKIEVPADVALFLDNLLQLAAGSHSINEIVQRIELDDGRVLQEREIILTLRALVDLGILLTELPQH
jgi:SAM-dependent methyltransferase